MAARFNVRLLRRSGVWGMAMFLVLCVAVSGGAYRIHFNQEADTAFLLPRCVSCNTKPLPEVVNGFLKINLGYPIANWFPVDVDEDGTWELAITVAGTPTRVGVYEPERQVWLDGPRDLPVVADHWGVVDWDHAGPGRYVYRAGQTLRSFDPRTDADSSLWSTDFIPAGMTVWGEDTLGNPLVAWLANVSGSCGEDCTRRKWQWWAFDVWTGRLVRKIIGSPGGARLLCGFPTAPSECMFIYESDAMIDQRAHVGSHWYYQSYRLVDAHWRVLVSVDLPMRYVGPGLHPPLNSWRLGYAGLTPAAPGEPDATVAWRVGGGNDYGEPAGDYFGANWGEGVSKWLVVCGACPPHAGLAFRNLTGDSLPEILLSLVSGAGWEIRGLADGAVIDTIEGMPRADLRNGPLYGLGRQDLFYLADSSLYIWEPDYVTPVIYDHPDDGEAAHLQIRAVPNPFNGSVTLSWLGNDSPTFLEIINVLGQTVRKFSPVDDAASEHSISWDGTDASSRPLASGLYFARVVTRAGSATTKIVLLR